MFIGDVHRSKLHCTTPPTGYVADRFREEIVKPPVKFLLLYCALYIKEDLHKDVVLNRIGLADV